MPGNDEVMKAIDSKLGALLALTVDEYLRSTGVGRPRPRSIDRVLADAGISVADIARILGKTERAVYLMLQPVKSNAKKAEVAE